MKHQYSERFQNILADPLNYKIERVENAGEVIDEYVVMCNGLKVKKNSYYGKFSDILVINKGVHEPSEEYVFYETIKSLKNENPVMVELGSYWAYYSMCFMKENPKGKCYMIEEMDPYMWVGQDHFKVNGFEGTFIGGRVCDYGIKIDDFVKKQEISKIDILLSDIQGSEFEMLMGSKQSLENKIVDYFFISTHSQKLHIDCTKFLIDYDYKIMASADFDNETFCHDGILIACSPKVELIKYDLGNRSELMSKQI